jgi:SAM-dependent methyltransferase
VRTPSRWLAHPLTRGLDLDDPRTTRERRQIVRSKRLLCGVYEDWYRAIAASLPAGEGALVELGAGAGFLDRCVPGLVRSEVFWCPWTDIALDGGRLPFGEGTLRGIAMTNVLHHLPDVSGFFEGAARCVRPGGVVAMVEPWNTPWSRWVYRRLHHEPFEPEAPGWELGAGGPLSSANGALPWILFARDRTRFEALHPEWELSRLELLMPLRYLISGGVSRRDLVPGFTAPLWRAAEALLHPLRQRLAMFAVIVLRRR